MVEGNSTGLYQKARLGGLLIGTSNGLKFLLTMVRTIVVARFLAPAEVGLMGILLFALAILESLSQTGFAAALIQQQKRIEPYLDTAWVVSLLRGIVLYCLLYFASPQIASFFNTPEASLLLKIVGIALLFEGIKNIGVVLFRKELDFKKEFIFQQIEVFTDIFVTITLAVIFQNVWALVIGYLSGKAIKCFSSFIMHPFRPALSFNAGKAKELFQFGKHMLGSSIIILLITQGDDAVVGKLLGTTALGFYVMAYKLSNLPATSITHAISQVAFPTYAKLQDDIDKLRSAYLKALKYISFFSVPVCGGLAILAPEIVLVFLGEKWREVIPVMQILCLFGLIRSLGGTTGPLFQGVGRPDITTKLNLAKLLVIAVLIIPMALRYNIVGVAWAVTIPMILDQMVSWHICARIIHGRIKQVLMTVVCSFAGTLFMMMVLQSCKMYFNLAVDAVTLFALISVGGIAYLLFCWIFSKGDILEISALLFPGLRKKEGYS